MIPRLGTTKESSNSLKNRWVPPSKKKEESKAEIKKKIVVEREVQTKTAKQKQVTSSSSATKAVEGARNNGKHTGELEEARKANEKINKWVSKPQNRKRVHPVKKQDDRYEMKQESYGKKRKVTDESTEGRKMAKIEKRAERLSKDESTEGRKMAKMEKRAKRVTDESTEGRKMAKIEKRAERVTDESTEGRKTAKIEKRAERLSKDSTSNANETERKQIKKIVDKPLVFETPNMLKEDKFSPSVVSDYATEASFCSIKSEQSHAAAAAPSGSPRFALGNVVAEWSPMPVISTINVKNSAVFEQPKAKSIEEILTKEKGEVPADSDSDSSSDSETDEEEVLMWAEKMFGVTPPELLKLRQQQVAESSDESSDEEESDEEVDRADPQATMFRRKPLTQPNKKKFGVKRKSNEEIEEETRKAAEDRKSKKEEAKPLTGAQIRAILGEDYDVAPSSHWVRRSSRQPCKAALRTPGVRAVLDKLRGNDSDMVVLKMKKYVNDPDTPQVVIDAVLDALEENTNCEALYIQVSILSALLLAELCLCDYF